MTKRTSPARHALTTLAFVAAGACIDAHASGQEVDPRDFLERASEIRGSVSVRGCVPDASAIDLRAEPLLIGERTRDGAALDPRALPLSARVTTTSDPHLFEFRIRGLRPLTLYQLSIAVPPSPICGTLFWRQSMAGLAASGGEPALIEGIAATTSLEVLQPATDQWVGADPVDFTDPAVATRRLRWRSALSGVIGGELQVSTARFPTGGDFGACDEPDDAVFHRQAVPAGDEGWTELPPIDLHSIVARHVSGGGGPVPGGISNATFRVLLLGAPIYARVVPMTASGPACDAREQGVAGWAILARPRATITGEPEPGPGPQVLEPGTGHHYRPPFFFRPSATQPQTIFPSYGDQGYRVVKSHHLPTYVGCRPDTTNALLQAGVPKTEIPFFADPLGCSLVQSSSWLGGATLNVGFRFVIHRTWSSGGGGTLLDSFVSLVTGTVNALGVGVNFGADIYNGAVDAAKSLAYDALLTTPGLGQLCDSHPSECQKGIDIGVTYGMTAMGLPPSVPNWDELKQEGLDYLAGRIGEQLEEETGGVLPAGITQAVLRELTQRAINQMTARRGGSEPTNNWFVGDSGFAPASWTVAIRNNDLDPLPLDVAMFSHQTALYESAIVPLPHRFPPPGLPGLQYSVLRVPMVLPPNLDGIPAPLCRSTYPAYSYPDPPQRCVAALPPGAEPICEFQHKNGPDSPWIRDDGCALLKDLVAVYYRNAWAFRVGLTACTTLTGLTVAHGPASTQYIPWPNYTFIVGAKVPPRLEGGWDGAFIDACPQP